MALLTVEEEKQLEMYRNIKSLVKSGRITLLQSTSDNNSIELTIQLTKSGKSIEKIISGINDGYNR